MPFPIIYDPLQGCTLLTLLERGATIILWLTLPPLCRINGTVDHWEEEVAFINPAETKYQMVLGHLTPMLGPFLFLVDSLYFLYHCTSQTTESGRMEVNSKGEDSSRIYHVPWEAQPPPHHSQRKLSTEKLTATGAPPQIRTIMKT